MHPERARLVVPALALVAAVLVGSPAHASSDVVNTPHNLSVSGPGPVRALVETRICVFCHTPHNAAPLSPLWNKQLEPQAYTVYTSPTLRAGPLAQPTGPTKLCLSCHDGTIAMGSVLNPSAGIRMSGGGTLPAYPGYDIGQRSLANLGLDLSGHHPVSFAYHDALPNAELAPTPPGDLVFGGTDEMHCTTCHDPHDNRNGRFLVKDNRNSELCTTCHQLSGWAASAHASSSASVGGILPRPPKLWPSYVTLGEWGCEACHTPHFAPTAPDLLAFGGSDGYSCTSGGCHGGTPAPAHTPARATGALGAGAQSVLAGRASQGADIARQIAKPSSHRPSARSAPGTHGVACSDCHDPHSVRAAPAEAPQLSGLLRGVSGTDRNGSSVAPARYEYEVCFKCHADDQPYRNGIPRVVSEPNLRRAFDPANPSFHPVVARGRNPSVPSIVGSLGRSMIYCSSCHADDEGGARGPHGSSFAPILKQRYETADRTPESYDNYALCYGCHDRSLLLRDVSFQRKAARRTATGGGHSGHLAAGVPCAACHDAHGVNDDGKQGTGDHTHLINFDVRIALPRSGATQPVFNDEGTFKGSCDLVCHGVVHEKAGYP